MLKGSVISSIFLKGRVLLVMRRDVPVWTLPGGGLEEGESPEDAILREIEEETGFRCEIVRKVGEYTPINRLSRFTHLFECRIVSGEAKIGPETRKIEFFDIDNLPKMPPPYEEWIRDCKKNLPNLIKRRLESVSYKNLVINFFCHPVLVFRFLLSKIGLSINS